MRYQRQRHYSWKYICIANSGRNTNTEMPIQKRVYKGIIFISPSTRASPPKMNVFQVRWIHHHHRPNIKITMISFPLLKITISIIISCSKWSKSSGGSTAARKCFAEATTSKSRHHSTGQKSCFLLMIK